MLVTLPSKISQKINESYDDFFLSDGLTKLHQRYKNGTLIEKIMLFRWKPDELLLDFNA